MANVYIDDADDLAGGFDRAFEAMSWNALIRPGQHVFLKPNLTYPRHRPGVTTSPAFIGKAIEKFKSLGAEVAVGEADGGYGAWSAEIAFEGHGLKRLCSRYGARLVNLSLAPSRAMRVELSTGAIELALPAILLEETDVFVSLPVPKIHAMTTYSGAVKNQWGCIPDRMRLRLHPIFHELIWEVNKRLGARLALGDGVYMLDGNGPMSGEPIYMNRVIAGEDLLAFDVAVATRLMTLDPRKVAYLVSGTGHGYSWEAEVRDVSTGPQHSFSCRPSLRTRVTAAAFTRQWAVNLLWFSRLGRLIHSVFYYINGNPIARERRAVEEGSRAANGESVPEQVGR